MEKRLQSKAPKESRGGIMKYTPLSELAYDDGFSFSDDPDEYEYSTPAPTAEETREFDIDYEPPVTPPPTIDGVVNRYGDNGQEVMRLGEQAGFFSNVIKPVQNVFGTAIPLIKSAPGVVDDLQMKVLQSAQWMFDVPIWKDGDPKNTDSHWYHEQIEQQKKDKESVGISEEMKKLDYPMAAMIGGLGGFMLGGPIGAGIGVAGMQTIFGTQTAGDVEEGLHSSANMAGALVGGALMKGGYALGAGGLARLGVAAPAVGGGIAQGVGALGGSIALIQPSTSQDTLKRIFDMRMKQAPNLTRLQWEEDKAAIWEAKASLVGWQEAGPEAFANLITYGLVFAKAPTRLAKTKSIEKFMQMYTDTVGKRTALKVAAELPVELGTETATAYLQSGTEAEIGLRGKPMTVMQSYYAIKDQTLSGVATIGGAMGAVDYIRGDRSEPSQLKDVPLDTAATPISTLRAISAEIDGHIAERLDTLESPGVSDKLRSQIEADLEILRDERGVVRAEIDSRFERVESGEKPNHQEVVRVRPDLGDGLDGFKEYQESTHVVEGLPAPRGVEGLPAPRGVEGLPAPRGVEGLPAPRGVEQPISISEVVNKAEAVRAEKAIIAQQPVVSKPDKDDGAEIVDALRAEAGSVIAGDSPLEIATQGDSEMEAISEAVTNQILDLFPTPKDEVVAPDETVVIRPPEPTLADNEAQLKTELEVMPHDEFVTWYEGLDGDGRDRVSQGFMDSMSDDGFNQRLNETENTQANVSHMMDYGDTDVDPELKTQEVEGTPISREGIISELNDMDLAGKPIYSIISKHLPLDSDQIFLDYGTEIPRKFLKLTKSSGAYKRTKKHDGSKTRDYTGGMPSGIAKDGTRTSSTGVAIQSLRDEIGLDLTSALDLFDALEQEDNEYRSKRSRLLKLKKALALEDEITLLHKELEIQKERDAGKKNPSREQIKRQKAHDRALQTMSSAVEEAEAGASVDSHGTVFATQPLYQFRRLDSIQNTSSPLNDIVKRRARLTEYGLIGTDSQLAELGKAVQELRARYVEATKDSPNISSSDIDFIVELNLRTASRVANQESGGDIDVATYALDDTVPTAGTQEYADRIDGTNNDSSQWWERQNAPQGMDLFTNQPTETGQVAGAFSIEGGKSVLRFFKDADLGTLIHENIHALEGLLTDEETIDLRRQYGVSEGGDWTTDSRELFAENGRRFFEDVAGYKGDDKSFLSKIVDWLKSLVGMAQRYGSEVEVELFSKYGFKPSEYESFTEQVGKTGGLDLSEVDISQEEFNGPLFQIKEPATRNKNATNQEEHHLPLETDLDMEDSTERIEPKTVLQGFSELFNKRVWHNTRGQKTVKQSAEDWHIPELDPATLSGYVKEGKFRQYLRLQADSMRVEGGFLGKRVVDEYSDELGNMLSAKDKHEILSKFKIDAGGFEERQALAKYGFASFLEGYVMAPGKTRALAPRFFKSFENRFPKYAGKGALSNLRELSKKARHAASSPYSSQQVSIREHLLDEKVETSDMNWVSKERFKWEVINSLHPFIEATTEALSLAGIEVPLSKADATDYISKMNGVLTALNSMGTEVEKYIMDGLKSFDHESTMSPGVIELFKMGGENKTVDQIISAIDLASDLKISRRTIPLVERENIRIIGSALEPMLGFIYKSRLLEPLWDTTDQVIADIYQYTTETETVSSSELFGFMTSIMDEVDLVIEDARAAQKALLEIDDEGGETKAAASVIRRLEGMKVKMPELLAKGLSKSTQLLAEGKKELFKQLITGELGGEESDYDTAIERVKVFSKREDYDTLIKMGDFIENWYKQLAQYSVDAQLYTQAFMDAMQEENIDYIQLQRVMTEDSTFHQAVQRESGGGDSIVRHKELIHKFMGSSKPVENTLMQMMAHTRNVVVAAHKNEVWRYFREIMLMTNDISQGATQNMAHQLDKDEVTEMKEAAFDTLIHRAKKGTPGTVAIFINGKPEYWKPAQDIKEAADTMVQESLNVPFLSKALKLWQSFALLNPAFPIANATRDYQNAGVVSADEVEKSYLAGFLGSLPLVGKYLKNSIKTAILNPTLRGEALAKVLESGTAVGWSSAFNEKHFETLLRRFLKEAASDGTKVIDPKKLRNLPKYVFQDMFQPLLGGSEILNRIPEFHKHYVDAKAKGLGEREAIQYAGYRQAGLNNFARIGRSMAKLSSLSPFMRPTITGMDSFYQAFKRSPGAVTGRMLLMNAPIVGLEMMVASESGDLEEWMNLPMWRRALTFNFPMPDVMRELGFPKWLTIPRGHSAGIVFAPIIASYEMIAGEGGDDMGKAMEAVSLGASSINPLDFTNILGPILSTPYEMQTGYDTFSQYHYIPGHEKGLPVPKRDISRASRLNKEIYFAVNNFFENFGVDVEYDPRNVDHAIRKLVPYWGSKALNLSNVAEDGVGAIFRTALSGLTGVTRNHKVTQDARVRKMYDVIKSYPDAKKSSSYKLFKENLPKLEELRQKPREYDELSRRLVELAQRVSKNFKTHARKAHKEGFKKQIEKHETSLGK